MILVLFYVFFYVFFLELELEFGVLDFFFFWEGLACTYIGMKVRVLGMRYVLYFTLHQQLLCQDQIIISHYGWGVGILLS